MDQSLLGMAGRLMMLVKAAFADNDVKLPDREVLYMAPIPADCEQVAVLFSGWTPTPFVDGPVPCISFRWLADFSVIVTRCTPAIAPNTKSGMPSADKMIEAAAIASQDAEILLQVLNSISEIGAPSVVVQSPVGGLQTVELNVQIPSGAL